VPVRVLHLISWVAVVPTRETVGPCPFVGLVDDRAILSLFAQQRSGFACTQWSKVNREDHMALLGHDRAQRSDFTLPAGHGLGRRGAPDETQLTLGR
jgi:hypothetical protein